MRNALFFALEDKMVRVTLWDADSKGIANKTVHVAVNGSVYSGVTDENGDAYIKVDLVSGVYDATVSFDGDDVYTASNRSGSIKVIQERSKIYLRNAMYFVLDTKMVKVTLGDCFGKPIAGKTVHIILNEYNLTYSGVTDENGTATIRVGVGFGVHSATVSFDGDEIYAASNRTGEINVIKETPSLMVRSVDSIFKVSDSPKTVKIYLWDRNSKPLPANSKVTMKINGHTYVGYTDASGIARINININKIGIYNAELKYAGNSAYNAVTRTTKIKIL